MPVARIPKIKWTFSHIIFCLSCCALFHRFRCRCSSHLRNILCYEIMSDKRVLSIFSTVFFHLCLSLLSRCKSICFDFVYSQTENVIFSLETYIRLYCLILGWISRMLAIACHRHRDYAQSLKYCNFKVNSNSFWLTRLSNMSKVKREREKLDFIRKKKIVKTNKQNVEQNNNNK